MKMIFSRLSVLFVSTVICLNLTGCLIAGLAAGGTAGYVVGNKIKKSDERSRDTTAEREREVEAVRERMRNEELEQKRNAPPPGTIQPYSVNRSYPQPYQPRQKSQYMEQSRVADDMAAPYEPSGDNGHTQQNLQATAREPYIERKALTREAPPYQRPAANTESVTIPPVPAILEQTEVPRDIRIKDSINRALLGGGATNIIEIRVSVSDGLATLNGNVANIALAEKAKEVAGNVSGVKYVISNLKLLNINIESPKVKPAAKLDSLKDALLGRKREKKEFFYPTENERIENEIIERILGGELSSVLRINSSVDNGVVTLEGNVPAQIVIDRAVSLAKNTYGVTEVKSYLVIAEANLQNIPDTTN